MAYDSSTDACAEFDTMMRKDSPPPEAIVSVPVLKTVRRRSKCFEHT
jgi:hypothetical protein